MQSNLRLSDQPIASDLIPLGQADLIISLEPMEALRYLPYLKKGRVAGDQFAAVHPTSPTESGDGKSNEELDETAA